MDPDSDDDNVHFGTPLEPLEEGSAAKRRPPALEDQTVRDSRGRQRFHGAFTGGFSAGFFNTVGSKDGFQPASFTSSRSTRAERRPARPDDFMDDEDRGEHGIAPQRVQARPEFGETPSGGVKRKRPQFDEGPIPGEPVLSQLVKPVRDTVGVRILRSMGWRPGQGIGPRISRAEKKHQQKVYGCARPPGMESVAPPPESDSDSDSDSAWREVLLAPDDSEAPLVRPKHDQMGLGYRGLERRSVLGPTAGDATLRYRDKAGKLAIAGQAFGVGAFEDEDEDIYVTEDMSNYDFESAPERTPSGRPAPSAADRLSQTLAGFRLSESRRPARQRYPPPPLPAGFTPRHRARPSRFEPLPEERRGLERHRLSAGQRADMIGERQQTPAAGEDSPAGVQTGMQAGVQTGTQTGVQTGTQAGAQAIAAEATPWSSLPGRSSGSEPVAPSGTKLPSTTLQSAHTPVTAGVKTGPGTAASQTETAGADRLAEVHRLLAEDAASPAAAAASLKPFARDPDKQSRYEQFLKLLAANRKDDYRLLLPASMTAWEREREVSEFQRSAVLFRPLAGSLADRFVSAGTSEQERPGTTGTDTGAAADPATQAARRKMFGTLTRRTQEWHPAPLLCRRFNVKNPFPHSSIVGTLGPTSSSCPDLALRPAETGTQPRAAAEPRARLRWDDAEPRTQSPAEAKPRLCWDDVLADEAPGGTAATSPPMTVATPPSSESTSGAVRTAAPAQKPPADLFKAIFDDSDTESESEAAVGERADSPGTPPLEESSRPAVTPSVTSALTPTVTDRSALIPTATDRSALIPTVTDRSALIPTVTDRSPPTVTSSSVVGEAAVPAARPDPTLSEPPTQPAAPTSRPAAAPLFGQAPPPAAKRPGFSLFDNVDLDELNSWRRGGGAGGGDVKTKPADSAAAPSAAAAVRSDTPLSADEYGPSLPPRPPADPSASLPVSGLGRGDGPDSDGRRRRERPSPERKHKKHKKSEKKKKKSKKKHSDSDSSDSGSSKTLFKKLRDVVMRKKKKKKKSSSRH